MPLSTPQSTAGWDFLLEYYGIFFSWLKKDNFFLNSKRKPDSQVSREDTRYNIYLFPFLSLYFQVITLLYAHASWTRTKLLTESQSKLIHLSYWKRLWTAPTPSLSEGKHIWKNLFQKTTIILEELALFKDSFHLILVI